MILIADCEFTRYLEKLKKKMMVRFDARMGS